MAAALLFLASMISAVSANAVTFAAQGLRISAYNGFGTVLGITALQNDPASALEVVQHALQPMKTNGTSDTEMHVCVTAALPLLEKSNSTSTGATYIVGYTFSYKEVINLTQCEPIKLGH